jgi:hypothetical protein
MLLPGSTLIALNYSGNTLGFDDDPDTLAL